MSSSREDSADELVSNSVMNGCQFHPASVCRYGNTAIGVFLAVYFSMVRWLDVHLKVISGEPGEPARLVPAVMISLLFVLLSIPFVAYMTESLIWFAAWLVRRRFIQNLLLRKRRASRP